MEITVKSLNVITSRTSKGTTLHNQQVALDQGRDYPLIFEVNVGKGDESPRPYPPGKYTFDATSFRLNPFGGVELNPYGIKLVPLTK